MVRSYDRWGPTQAFGVICSAASPSVFDGRLAYVPALEDILVWDVKKGQMLAMWHETGHRAEVTCITQSPQPQTFAVGYADGSIRIWNSNSASVTVTLNGHKKAVTVMTFDATGTRLASGSQDTSVILWDVVGETGLFKLRGHRDQITGITFLEDTAHYEPSTSTGSTQTRQFLITCGKDTFLKVWDLGTQHCIQTIVAHSSEVWALDIDAPAGLLFTGSGEGEVKAWKIDKDALAMNIAAGELGKVVLPYANLPVSSRHRIAQILFHPSSPYLAIQSHDRSIEIFRIRTNEEIRKKQARRQKRAKEKKGVDQDLDNAEGSSPQIELVDRYTPHVIVRASGKVRSFDFVAEESSPKGISIFVSLSSNAVEVYNIPPPSKGKDILEVSRLHSLDLPGHRTDIRTVSLSADEELLATGSNGLLKIWNMKSMACIRTFECGHSICSSFLPGDKHVVVGTKSGEILLYDIAASSLLEKIEAHSNTIWSLHARPDFSGLVTGSADKDVKFWSIEERADAEVPNRKTLALVHAKTLKMTDEVLAVKYSPNNRFLAVSLLDATVKVFYQDTLKFFLSLYGHKLPVLSLDISSDSKLIITCSADKNVKIWGLDFGDCHKSLFAHDESVMQVVFQPRTHNFFSVSKDKYLKYWDGDKFELIQKLDGHHSEIWAIAAGRNGNFVVTGSHDKSIRVWERTEEPLFLEEERERELEKLFGGDIADNLNREDGAIGSGVDGASNDVEMGLESSVVQKHTTETLMAGEKIMEAIDLADTERETMRKYNETIERMPEGERGKYGAPPRNPVLQALDVTAEEYVLQTLGRVLPSALYDALLVLPFSKVTSLLHYLDVWAQQGISTTLTSQILSHLLRTHSSQIVATRSLRPVMMSLRTHLRGALTIQKSEIGYNLAALRFLKRQENDARTAALYEKIEGQAGGEEQITLIKEQIQNSKKRKRVAIKF